MVERERRYTIVAVYNNKRPNDGPFLRGPLLEEDEGDGFWVTVGFHPTPGSEQIRMRYPSENVTVVPIGKTSEGEAVISSGFLGFSRIPEEPIQKITYDIGAA